MLDLPDLEEFEYKAGKDALIAAHREAYQAGGWVTLKPVLMAERASTW